ncbi:MAG: putative quinol monooxygenase [Mycobacterium sp.]
MPIVGARFVTGATTMPPLGFLVELEALPGKAAAVADFLAEAKKLVDDEPGTLAWFAFQRGPTSFGIFDVFGSAADREAHLHGEVRKALEARGPELFSAQPVISPVDVLATKLPDSLQLPT